MRRILLALVTLVVTLVLLAASPSVSPSVDSMSENAWNGYNQLIS